MMRISSIAAVVLIFAFCVTLLFGWSRMGLFKDIFGSKPKPDLQAFERTVDQAMEELQLKTSAHDGAWHIGNAKWEVDQDKGTIVFTSNNGIVATCDVQIIGTRNEDDGSWMWAWDHPSVPPELQKHAMRVREYGSENNFNWLTTQMIQCPEDKAWQLTALACKLNGAQGAYRGPAGQTSVYMTFDNVRLTKAE